MPTYLVTVANVHRKPYLREIFCLECADLKSLFVKKEKLSTDGFGKFHERFYKGHCQRTHLVKSVSVNKFDGICVKLHCNRPAISRRPYRWQRLQNTRVHVDTKPDGHGYRSELVPTSTGMGAGITLNSTDIL